MCREPLARQHSAAPFQKDEYRNMAEPQFLDTDEASRFLTELGIPIAAQTLKNARSKNAHYRGPRYIKVGGKVRYKRADLERYLEQSAVDPSKVA